MGGQMLDEILDPFLNLESAISFQEILRDEFNNKGVSVTERRINPLSATLDMYSTFMSNFKNKNYRRAGVDLFYLGVQPLPAYVITNFKYNDNGSDFNKITLNFTGVVIPWLTLPLEFPFLGAPALAVNLYCWAVGFITESNVRIHEYNHIFDKYVLKVLHDNDLCPDVEKACSKIHYEPPYQPLTFNQLRNRAENIIESM